MVYKVHRGLIVKISEFSVHLRDIFLSLQLCITEVITSILLHAIMLVCTLSTSSTILVHPEKKKVKVFYPLIISLYYNLLTSADLWSGCGDIVKTI